MLLGHKTTTKKQINFILETQHIYFVECVGGFLVTRARKWPAFSGVAACGDLFNLHVKLRIDYRRESYAPQSYAGAQIEHTPATDRHIEATRYTKETPIVIHLVGWVVVGVLGLCNIYGHIMTGTNM